MKKNYSLNDKKFCKKLVAICIAVILIASFFAQMVSTDGGKIKVETIRIDARGAELVGDLYYPAGTSDRDKLPAIVVTHGAGVTKNNYRSFAEELSRRKFVVFCVNGYGTGLSEFPKYDENNMGVDEYNTWTTPSGILDAVNFVRTLQFVDKERIGIAGHSQGSRRAGYSAVIDCGYLTLNDMLINVLYEQFGQSFTEQEINMNADELAADRLSEEELALYEYIKADVEEEYNSKILAVCIIGGTASNCGPMKAVNVAGFEVMRNCQVNEGLIGGDFDGGIAAYRFDPANQDFWHVDGDIQLDTWYDIDDAANTSTVIGDFNEIDITTSEALQDAIKNRTTRLIVLNPETHSKEFFSKQTAAEVSRYFEQVFAYNGGELGDASANPIPATKTKFVAREILNAVAMLGMIALLFPVAGLMVNTEFFAGCIGKNEVNTTDYGKKRFWVCAAVGAVSSFAAIYYINTIFAPGLPSPKFWPLFPSWWLTLIYLAVVAVFSVAEIVVLNVIDKKKYGKSFLGSVNVRLGVVNVLKSVLLGCILTAVAYLSLTLILYLFNQDYRLWMMAFEEMKVEHWLYVWRFAIVLFPLYVLTGIALNYSNSDKIAGWKSVLVDVIANSLGVWVLAIVTTIILHKTGNSISNWTSSYGFIFFVPITIIISKLMYKVTRSVWLGAAVNSLLIGWMMVCTIGYNTYVGQAWFSNFFNI
ncbi:MAG: hypothetical protein SPE18_00195 [Candidatus Limivicinus sp.]|nr:hypothetical protein [Candidatus Limivicinus sp.]